MRNTETLISRQEEKNLHLYAFGVMAVFTLVRLWVAASGQIDLAQDEAQYWDWSRNLQLSYYSKGPLIAWVIALFTSLFGNTELGVRFGAVLGNLAVQGLLYFWLARLLNRPRLALITLLIANSAPLFIASGVLMTTDNPLLVMWTLGLVCLTGLTERPKALWPFAGLFIASALGILSKYMMAAFAGIAVLYIWRLHRRAMLPKGHGKKAVAAVLAGLAAGLLPIVLWNMQNGFAGFLHVGRLAGVAPAPGETPPLIRFDRFPEYFGSQALVFLPWWLGFMLRHGARLVSFCRAYVPSGPDRNWLIHTAGQKNRSLQREGSGYRFALLLCLGFWPLWLFFIVWSFHTRIYPNWSAMSYAAGMVIAAAGVEEVWRNGGRGLPWLKGFAAASLVLSLCIHGQSIVTRLIPLPDQYNPTMRVKGWSDLGKRLDELRRAMPNPDKVFFFSDSYDVTASLAFYIPGQPKTYCADFGRRFSQYDLWPDPNGDTLISLAAEKEEGDVLKKTSPRLGWDAIYVERGPIGTPPSRLKLMFDNAKTPPTPYESRHEDGKGRTFGFMPVYGYKGVWPRPSQGIY